MLFLQNGIAAGNQGLDNVRAQLVCWTQAYQASVLTLYTLPQTQTAHGRVLSGMGPYLLTFSALSLHSPPVWKDAC